MCAEKPLDHKRLIFTKGDYNNSKWFSFSPPSTQTLIWPMLSARGGIVASRGWVIIIVHLVLLANMVVAFRSNMLPRMFRQFVSGDLRSMPLIIRHGRVLSSRREGSRGGDNYHSNEATNNISEGDIFGNDDHKDVPLLTTNSLRRPTSGRSLGQRKRPARWTDEEDEGPYHDILYGVNPVLMALNSDRRELHKLVVQSTLNISNRRDDKGPTDILRLCEQRGIPKEYASKQELNRLTDDGLHQGFALFSSPIEPLKLDKLESSAAYRFSAVSSIGRWVIIFYLTCRCVLALDEVGDPQNLGALLRTSRYLGVDKVVICSKNSAPLSPAVSKASAGALEIMPVYRTNNMPQFLQESQKNGWQVRMTFVLCVLSLTPN
jgi:tRNA G18 (ribose-2'-O)-methylase SpoU